MEAEEHILKVKFHVDAFRLYLEHKLVQLLFSVFNSEVKRTCSEKLQYLLPRKYLNQIAVVLGEVFLFINLRQIECVLLIIQGRLSNVILFASPLDFQLKQTTYFFVRNMVRYCVLRSVLDFVLLS